MKLLPSNTLALYCARMFLVRFLAFTIGIVLVLQALDLMNESDAILSAAGSGYGQLVQYIGLRVPQLVKQFAPFAALLAALLTFATLNQNSEIIIMKASGLSAHRILLPFLGASLVIALFLFLFNEGVVAPTTARLDAWQDRDYAGSAPETAARAATRAWIKDGKTIINAQDVRYSKGQLVLSDVTILEGSVGPAIGNLTKAARAVYDDGSWKLQEVKRYDLNRLEVSESDGEAWDTALPPDRFLAVAVVPDKVAFPTLYQAVQELGKSGHQTATLQAALWHKIASPLSTLLMPLLAAVAAFGLHRSGQLFPRIVIGLALGFAFFVADNFMMAMGQFGVAPPLLAAWAPFFLFFFVGESVLFRTEE
jgi:lipopolysaccharide export system permease protein